MTFSRMWYWSNTSATNTIAVRSGVGAPIHINQSGRQIIITLPDGSIASEIAIEYPIEHMEFSYQSKSSQENEIVASKKFGEELVFIQLNGFVTSEDAAVEKEIMFDINGSPEHEIDLVIHYRFIGSGSETIGSGSYRLNYLPMPDEFSLYQNYPNPFNPVTQIKYDLPEASHVQLFIYDILGREVTALVNEVQEPGYRSITWHGTDAFGRNVGAGMYFYSIQAGDFRQTKKMVLLK
ncbi:MAG: T9SS type A sorting domain-containing protein [Candidatus Marinimicrobia bacterium]|nr:T9SS type A sorting domain-containing protein [Candidatus Neomarinimicrobiota bacterium]